MAKKWRFMNRGGRRFNIKIKRLLKKIGWQNLALIFGAIILVLILNYMENKRMQLNYTTLLDTIASVESRGNYNAYFGNSTNQDLKLTEMTINEIKQWQADFVASGQASNAVGRYQIISPTLDSLVQKMGLKGEEKFSPEVQDAMAIKLLEKRGVYEYANGKISREEFAHNLSQEWAALPKVLGDNPSASYYAGDGLNKSHLSIEKIISAIETLKNGDAV